MSGPVASPTASSGKCGSSRALAVSGQLSAAKDSLPASPSRITANQLQVIAGRLTGQDWRVLGFLAASRLATGKQLVQGLWMADRHSTPSQARIARRGLKRLSDLRVLDPLPGRTVGGLHGGSDTIVYGVGVAGARLLAQRGQHQRRLGTPGARHVTHTLASTQIAVDVNVLAARGQLELIEIQQEPECWRTFLGPMAARLTCKPDLFVRVAAPGSIYEHRWMIEVDMATEASATIRSKALRHLAYLRSASEPAHPRVLWAVPDTRRAEQVCEVLRRLPAPADRLFQVCLMSEVVGFLIAEARS